MLLTLQKKHQHKLTEVTLEVKLIYCLPAFVLVMVNGCNAFNALVLVMFLGLSWLLTSLTLKELFSLYILPFFFIITGCFTVVMSINSGHKIIEIGNYSIGYTDSGIQIAISTLSRCFALISIVYFGLLIHSISELAEIMRRCRFPKIFIDLFIITYKFIENLIVSTKQLYTAQQCRLAYVHSGNKLHSFSMLISAVFSKAISQTRYLQLALDSRCTDDEFTFVRKRVKFSIKNLYLPLFIHSVLLTVFLIGGKYGW